MFLLEHLKSLLVITNNMPAILGSISPLKENNEFGSVLSQTPSYLNKLLASLKATLVKVKLEIEKIEIELKKNNLNDELSSHLGRERRKQENEKELLEFKIQHIERKIAKYNTIQELTTQTPLKVKESAASSINSKAKQNAEKYFLYTCSVNLDGIGDLGHFMDIAKMHGVDDGLEEYAPLFIIAYCKPKHTQEQILTLLKSNGFDIKAPNLHIMPVLNVSQYLETSKILQEQLLCTKAMWDISIPSFDIQARSPDPQARALITFFDKHHIKIPCIMLAEQHSDYFLEHNNEALNYYTMGIGCNDKLECHPRVGFLIKQIEKKNFSECCKILSDIGNVEFLRVLLDSKDPSTLLKNALIVPGYCQGTAEKFLQWINLLADSPLVSNCTEIVFIINKGNIHAEVTQYEGHLSNTIQNFSITTKEGNLIKTQHFNNAKNTVQSTVSRVSVRIIEGFWLSESDYHILYQCAKVGIFSGDKSLEKTFSYRLIPFGQVRGWKFDLFDSLGRLVQAILSIELAEYEVDVVTPCLPLLWERYDNPECPRDLLKNLNAEFQRQWEIVLTALYDYHNLYHKLPAIKQWTLELTKKIIPTEYYAKAETIFEKTNIHAKHTQLVMGYLYGENIKEYESMAKALAQRATRGSNLWGQISLEPSRNKLL